jgi:hypothetical protein
MEKYFQAIFDLKKLPSQICVVIAATGAFLFYAPKKWVLIEIKPEEDIYIYAYIAFLASVSIVILSVLKSIGVGLKNLWLYFGNIIEINREISMLKEEEKAVLREFYVQRKRQLYMPTNDSVVKELWSKSIIQSESGVFTSGRPHPFKINDIYRKHINPIKDLEIPTKTSSLGVVKKFEESRPYWV